MSAWLGLQIGVALVVAFGAGALVGVHRANQWWVRQLEDVAEILDGPEDDDTDDVDGWSL